MRKGQISPLDYCIPVLFTTGSVLLCFMRWFDDSVIVTIGILGLIAGAVSSFYSFRAEAREVAGGRDISRLIRLSFIWGMSTQTILLVALLVQHRTDQEDDEKQERRFTELVNDVTGGSSQPFVLIDLLSSARQPHLRWQMENLGTNSLHDVYLEMIDVSSITQAIARLPKDAHYIEREKIRDSFRTRIEIGSVPSESSIQFDYTNQPSSTSYNRWTVNISALNGRWTQKLSLWWATNYWIQENSATPIRQSWIELREHERKAQSSP